MQPIFITHLRTGSSPCHPFPYILKEKDLLKPLNCLNANCCDFYIYGYAVLHMEKCTDINHH